ncbi:MAG: hypothetical protein NTZ99_10735 [Burkholderiales bacterium]|jgi:hypothetical protein|nr:hypothetical protein [Burkholderiales bacterium]
MRTPHLPIRRIFLSFFILFTSLACSPHWNWREVKSNDAPFSVLLPDKPVNHSRNIDLIGLQVTMTMTAAEVDGVNFAVGSIQLPDKTKTEAALNAMQFAMIKNIQGQVREKKIIKMEDVTATQIIAQGRAGNTAQPLLLAARFVSKDLWVHQVIALGPEKNFPPDAIETFLTSFKLN